MNDSRTGAHPPAQPHDTISMPRELLRSVARLARSDAEVMSFDEAEDLRTVDALLAGK